eukprot:4079823-Pyramimonas_sp.AAC.1
MHAITSVLRDKGLVVHELEEGSTDCAFLGMELSGGIRSSIKRRNIWRLRLGIEELISRRCCSGAMLQVLVGHITWACLLKREALVALDACYAFIIANPAE